jgi:hypothetical protein
VQDSVPLITPRVLAGLSVVAITQAALVATCVWPDWGLFAPEVLPASLAAAALSLALLLAPAWSADHRARCESPLQQAGRFAFLGLWQAAVLGFFLLISARVAPLASSAIVQSALILGAAAWLALTASRRWPRAYLGLALFWGVAIPMGAFIVAEVFIWTPNGSLGWSRAKGPGVEVFRGTVEWLLRFSPGTAIVGTLQGHLPGDAPCGWREAGLFTAICTLIGGLLHWTRSAKPAEASATPEAVSAKA